VNMLLEAERLAPEAVRYQVIVKEMLRELLRREHRASTPVASARGPDRHHPRVRVALPPLMGGILLLPWGLADSANRAPARTPVLAVLSYRLVSLSDRTGRSPAQIQEREVAGGAR
jgi:hypothetical protein